LPPGKQKNDYGFDFWIFIDYWNHLLDIYDCNIADDLSAKKMTTFTSEDRIAATTEPVVIVNSGANVMDKEDTESMLRHQLQIMQAEIQRLRKKLMEAGIYD